MSDESGRVVRIERTFAASAEEVFDAWTSPDVMRRWFHCNSAWETPVADVDLQVGGKIRVVMRRPDGTEVEAQGIFHLIDQPHRLVGRGEAFLAELGKVDAGDVLHHQEQLVALPLPNRRKNLPHIGNCFAGFASLRIDRRK